MLQRTIAVFTAGAKVGAIALALSVGGYLIVNAQRRANPQPVENAPVPEGAAIAEQVSAASSGAVTPAQVDEALTFLSSSKSLVLEQPEPPAAAGPVFFAGSKSMVITDTSIAGAGTNATNITPPFELPPPGAPLYLPSSKSLSPGSIVYPTPLPKQGATPGGAPGQP